MKDLSIIVPVYNTSKYLRKCLDSLLMQEPAKIDYEIIVVNDGTPDNSEEIILEYQNQYPDKINYVVKKNGGISSARNEGLKHAKGEFVLFVDSDDYVEKTLLSVFAQKNKNDDLFVYGYTMVYEDNQKSPQENIVSEEKTVDGKEALSIFFEQKAVRGYTWNKFFKTRILRENKITFDENIRYIEDLLFVIEYVSKCHTVFFTPISLYNYLQREGSLVNSTFHENKLSALLAYEKLIALADKINPAYLPTVYYFFFELNYELSVRIRISNQSSKFTEKYQQLRQNMKTSFRYFIGKKVKPAYKIKAIIKSVLYEPLLLKHGGKNEKN